ncbi:MAG TPA: hypothetical protein VK973_06090 [Arenicellales bacterium]|nr:hypothetical protein [Arenicellales bacterium]
MSVNTIGDRAMSAPDPDTVSRFVHLYRGIEDFYFLNRNGELGYIKSGQLRSVKETFPQLRDRVFLSTNPGFLPALEDFLRSLGEIADTYVNDPPSDLELGYLLPAGDQHLWRTATLVLHKHVLEALRADFEIMARDGTRELIEAERELSRIMGVRSIHQGLDELTHHKDSFDQYRYFPVLFLLPENENDSRSGTTRSRVRVINLRWRGRGLDRNRNGPGAVSAERELVFRILRENLSRRGAIDRSQRVENRLSLA